MKQHATTLLFFCILSCIFAFTWNTETNYAELLDAERTSEYLHSSSSEELKTNLGSVFSNFFDEVVQVDVHYGTEREYYYTVYGKKEETPVVKSILVSERMAKRHFFPTREQLGMGKEKSMIVICYREKGKCGTTSTDDVCGIIISGEKECADFDIIIRPLPLPKPIDL